jgi:hypothetical protein
LHPRAGPVVQQYTGLAPPEAANRCRDQGRTHKAFLSMASAAIPGRDQPLPTATLVSPLAIGQEQMVATLLMNVPAD